MFYLVYYEPLNITELHSSIPIAVFPVEIPITKIECTKPLMHILFILLFELNLHSEYT